MTMRVLVATDGSGDAKLAVEWLHHLPLPPDREVMVITVVTPPLVSGVPDMAVELRAALIAPREEIVEAARSWGADLVVLGARGLGAIKEFLLGSVSLWVARHAPCPVLVCKGTPRDVHAITAGVDGSSHARAALDWLTLLSLPPALHVRLLGVAERQHYPSSAPDILREALRTAVAAVDAERGAMLEAALRDAAQTLRGRVTVETAVETGAPAETIVQDAERSASDLIVVGARGAGTLTRLLLGSVSESVLRHAVCPVLVVRAPAAGGAHAGDGRDA